MAEFFDPNDTLIRLIRGTTYDSADHHVNKAKALSPFSVVAAAAYGRMSEREADRRQRPLKKAAADAAPSLDEEEAVRVDFHAADARLIIRTMIAAMAAAGESREQEQKHILAYLQDAGGTAAEIQFAEHEMRHPASAEELAHLAGTRETAVEIYAAALLATKAANEDSRVFLSRLASALKLEPEFVRDLHAKWDDPPPA